MAKVLMILAALFALAGCGGDGDNAQTDADTSDEWTMVDYAGLQWSPLLEYEKTWQKAMDYCEARDARLPTIDELRKLIINCSGSTYGGACQVSDPDRLSTGYSSYDDCCCSGNAASYSALGDGKDIALWSSSSRADDASGAWHVDFNYGYVDDVDKSNNFHVRCVR